MRRNNIRKHFSTLSNDTGAPTKKFWDSVTPFLNDKGSHGNENYSLIEDGKLITDEGRVSEIFNDHCINIVENLTGEKQEGLHTGILNDKSQNETKSETKLDASFPNAQFKVDGYHSPPPLEKIEMVMERD